MHIIVNRNLRVAINGPKSAAARELVIEWTSFAQDCIEGLEKPVGRYRCMPPCVRRNRIFSNNSRQHRVSRSVPSYRNLSEFVLKTLGTSKEGLLALECRGRALGKRLA
jgi:hypothetical protein